MVREPPVWTPHVSGKVMSFRVTAHRLDHDTGKDLKATVAAAVSAQHRLLVLDMSGVMFMDSLGLAALVATLKLVEPPGVLALSGLSTPVRTLLNLSRLGRAFRVFRTLSEAVQALAVRAG